MGTGPLRRRNKVIDPSDFEETPKKLCPYCGGTVTPSYFKMPDGTEKETTNKIYCSEQCRVRNQQYKLKERREVYK